MQETWVRSLGWEDPLEEETATHSSILAWETPGTEKPCRLQLVWLRNVGYDLVTKNNVYGTIHYSQDMDTIQMPINK